MLRTWSRWMSNPCLPEQVRDFPERELPIVTTIGTVVGIPLPHAQSLRQQEQIRQPCRIGSRDDDEAARAQDLRDLATTRSGLSRRYSRISQKRTQSNDWSGYGNGSRSTLKCLNAKLDVPAVDLHGVRRFRFAVAITEVVRQRQAECVVEQRSRSGDLSTRAG